MGRPNRLGELAASTVESARWSQSPAPKRNMMRWPRGIPPLDHTGSSATSSSANRVRRTRRASTISALARFGTQAELVAVAQREMLRRSRAIKPERVRIVNRSRISIHGTKVERDHRALWRFEVADRQVGREHPAQRSKRCKPKDLFDGGAQRLVVDQLRPDLGPFGQELESVGSTCYGLFQCRPSRQQQRCLALLRCSTLRLRSRI